MRFVGSGYESRESISHPLAGLVHRELTMAIDYQDRPFYQALLVISVPLYVTAAAVLRLSAVNSACRVHWNDRSCGDYLRSLRSKTDVDSNCRSSSNLIDGIRIDNSILDIGPHVCTCFDPLKWGITVP